MASLALLVTFVGCAKNKGVSVGFARTRSHSLPTGKWVDISIVIDNDRRVYDVTIGGV